MSDERPMTPEERDLLAAEHALGLLTGDEAAEAASRWRDDPEFRRAAARWSGRLAPLAEEAADKAPPPRVRVALEARLGSEPARGANDNEVRLRRRMNLWRAWAGAATAIAASLALVLATRPDAPAPVPAGQPMVATMAAAGSEAKIVATWDPASRSLVVAAAAAAPAPAAHGHELWMIPAAGGKPHPMGMMPVGKPMHVQLPVEVAEALGEGVTLAVSIEPAGGSPTGLPTGPVIAAGKLVRT
jgi:anti-sigma-K factor RskA